MTNNQSQGYPQRWVWAACAHIYGDPISDRTWRKYKDICQVPDCINTPLIGSWIETNHRYHPLLMGVIV